MDWDIRELNVVGERHSGTNWLTTTLEHTFELPVKVPPTPLNLALVLSTDGMALCILSCKLVHAVFLLWFSPPYSRILQNRKDTLGSSTGSRPLQETHATRGSSEIS